LKITLVCFGKLKTPGLKQAAHHYLKMSQTSVHIQEIELKPQKIYPNDILDVLRKKEEVLMLQTLKKHHLFSGRVYLLDMKAPSLSSLQWASQIKALKNQGCPSITFCLGSRLGFSSLIYQSISKKISLGPQTLSYELARVVLLEQLFRAFCLINNHPYHTQD